MFSNEVKKKRGLLEIIRSLGSIRRAMQLNWAMTARNWVARRNFHIRTGWLQCETLPISSWYSVGCSCDVRDPWAVTRIQTPKCIFCCAWEKRKWTSHPFPDLQPCASWRTSSAKSSAATASWHNIRHIRNSFQDRYNVFLHLFSFLAFVCRKDPQDRVWDVY